MAGVIYVASKLYKLEKITTGEISAFLFYLTMLVFNFGMVAMVFGTIAGIVGASDNVVEVMNRVPAINSKGGDIIDG